MSSEERRRGPRPPLDPSFRAATGAAGALMVLLQIVPILALVGRALTFMGGRRVITPGTVADALILSLGTTGISMLIVALLGTPLALILARARQGWLRALSVVVELPIVMPPVVAGLALLAAFGRRGLLGGALSALGVHLAFTPLAVILAQVFVSAPFFIRTTQTRFSALPRELEEAAQIDGADAWGALRHVVLPLSLPALLTGLMLSWARALGEFGATILFAGNFQGKTQTMPLLVYGALERDLGATYHSALILLGLAALALVATRLLLRLEDGEPDPLSGG
jgi:molybdate transport system permease protein